MCFLSSITLRKASESDRLLSLIDTARETRSSAEARYRKLAKLLDEVLRRHPLMLVYFGIDVALPAGD